MTDGEIDIFTLTRPQIERARPNATGVLHFVLPPPGGIGLPGRVYFDPNRPAHANLKVVGRNVVAIAPIPLGVSQSACIWTECFIEGLWVGHMYRLTITATLEALGVPPTPTPAPAITALPQQDALAERWSADTIDGLSNGQALATWTGARNAIPAGQANAANQPSYRTGGAGGKPYVLMNGAHGLLTGTGTPVNAAFVGQACTMIVVCRNVQSTNFGFLASATPSTGFQAFANGSSAGGFGISWFQVPFAGAGLTTITRVNRSPDESLQRTYINGTCFGTHGQATYIGAGFGTETPFCIGSGSAHIAALASKAEIYEVIVWPVALTAAEMMQAEKWVREKYASPFPWAGRPFRVFHGDSITNGGSGDPLNDYPYLVAQANGYPIGSWTNLAHGGRTMEQLRAAAAASIDPLVAMLGVPVHVAIWEWFNQKALGGAGAWAQTKAYLQERRAAGVAKLIVGTSTDATNEAESAADRAARAEYDALVAANWATYADAYAPLHLNPHIGVEGSIPDAAPYGDYCADGIHMKSAGNAEIAGVFRPVIPAS